MSEFKPNPNASKILATLAQVYAEDGPALEYQSVFQLLVAVMLSAQTNDNQVNKITRQLFVDYGTPQALAMADELRRIVEHNRLPRTGDVVLMYIWATVFTGSILSMILALIARARRVPLQEKEDTKNFFR